MKTNCFSILFAVLFLAACSSKSDKIKSQEEASIASAKNNLDSMSSLPAADIATILSKKEVPVLCYHHIREAKAGQSESMKSYSVSPAQFGEQMKALKDSGYETVLPDQLYNYLVYNGKLPAKPVMLTFDDTDEEQYSIGAADMEKYGFKGVYFIMTISINRPRYMSKEQLKELADKGNVVEGRVRYLKLLVLNVNGLWNEF